MSPAARRGLLLACSLAFAPLLAASWEIKMNDFEEKDVDEFNSNGFKCPTCFAVMESVTMSSSGAQQIR
ncbi:hypothetical protein VULLAG_LOCUS5278 [Vulpes lagopus]